MPVPVVGTNINNASDVAFDDLADGEVMVYDGGHQKWKNVAQATLTSGGGTSTTDLTAHAASDQTHGAPAGAKLAVIHGGGRNIFVQNTEPTAELAGDIWVDTSGAA